MKEATGELNMTVITVVAIAAVAGIFYAFVWPGIQDAIKSQTMCSYGTNYTTGTEGSQGYINCGSVEATGNYTCSYVTQDSNGNLETKSVTCKQTK